MDLQFVGALKNRVGKKVRCILRAWKNKALAFLLCYIDLTSKSSFTRLLRPFLLLNQMISDDLVI